MSKRKETTVAPEPLEEYSERFDDLFEKWNQREGFRRYLEGLLLPTERNKTLTGLANTEPVVGAQDRPAQFLQWFLSEADWDERKIQTQRLQLLLKDPLTAPSGHGVLVIDEHGDRKAGTHIAHVGRQTVSWLVARRRSAGIAQRGGTGSGLEKRSAAGPMGQSRKDVSGWIQANVVGSGSPSRSLRAREDRAGGDCHH